VIILLYLEVSSLYGRGDSLSLYYIYVYFATAVSADEMILRLRSYFLINDRALTVIIKNSDLTLAPFNIVMVPKNSHFVICSELFFAFVPRFNQIQFEQP
jgi:hypothetical protein